MGENLNGKVKFFFDGKPMCLDAVEPEMLEGGEGNDPLFLHGVECELPLKFTALQKRKINRIHRKITKLERKMLKAFCKGRVDTSRGKQ